ncbi:hypothetical protein AFK69_14265 [Xenorhabdus sp. GDc328]|nr:hypothetical protein AAY47_05135 [Xenorhabdus griffiniae]KOP32587.1 hypothetical protein AFK69_14265 [Xenorhabdus sp. GDc328]
MLMGIIYGVINLSLFIPDFGFLLFNLLDPLFSAGIITICETQRMTGKFKFGRLFIAFTINVVLYWQSVSLFVE